MNFKDKIAEKARNLPETVRTLTAEELMVVNGGTGHFGQGCVGSWSDGNGFTQACTDKQL